MFLTQNVDNKLTRDERIAAIYELLEGSNNRVLRTGDFVLLNSRTLNWG